MLTLLRQLVRDDAGQDLIEYALLAGFIALASVAMITSIGTGVNTVYTNVNTQVDAAAAADIVETGRHRVLACGDGGERSVKKPVAHSEQRGAP